MLHLTKVAYGAGTIDEVVEWFARREPVTRHTTRYKPKRFAEMDGGSLFWILKHRLVARSEILGFEEAEGGKTDILLSNRLIRVVPIAKRAHQGWRYLEAVDAPADLVSGAGAADLPPVLQAELAELGLL